MITNKGKRIILTLFAFLGSYIFVYLTDPYSLIWQGYFNRTMWEIVGELFFSFIFCAAISEVSLLIDRKFNKKMRWDRNPLKRLIIQGVVQIVIILLLTLTVHFFLIAFLDENHLDINTYEARHFWQWIIATVLIALMISAINTGNFLITNWKTTAMEAAEHKLRATEHQLKSAQHKQAATESELQALKLQLDSHFVFNNLSILSELILEDQKLGFTYAENFTKVYRYLLVNSQKNLITLEEELKFLNAYLFLVKHRIGNGVSFKINIKREKLFLQIPPLTTQLLIENALKHNSTIKNHPLEINIYSNDYNELVIINKLIPLVTRPNSAGIGLNNIINRYALISNKNLIIEKSEDCFTVKVPLIL